MPEQRLADRDVLGLDAGPTATRRTRVRAGTPRSRDGPAARAHARCSAASSSQTDRWSRPAEPSWSAGLTMQGKPPACGTGTPAPPAPPATRSLRRQSASVSLPDPVKRTPAHSTAPPPAARVRTAERRLAEVEDDVGRWVSSSLRISRGSPRTPATVAPGRTSAIRTPPAPDRIPAPAVRYRRSGRRGVQDEHLHRASLRRSARSARSSAPSRRAGRPARGRRRCGGVRTG